MEKVNTIKNKIIAIIPARGGSKGIPRKNIRLLVGKPLISYSIETALQSKYINDVVVSTDDDEIGEISRMYGAQILKRPKELAEDETPLDPVIVHAVKKKKKEKNINYDLVVTIQPTSPLLTVETLDKAIEAMIAEDCDTLLPVKDDTHLFLMKKEGKFIPIYKERVNRQYLDPIYQEVGTPLIAKREIMNSGSRLGKNIFYFEMPDKESIDIDTALDWQIIEALLKRLRIVFRTNAGVEMGTGHACRASVLADKLRIDHDVSFLIKKESHLAMEKLKEYRHKIIIFENEESFFAELEKINPDIVVNDILATEKEYIERLKKKGYSVVNFDDLGEGSKIADLTINAIYEEKPLQENHYYGHKYMCLRDEFSIVKPKKQIDEKTKNILITFGGSDPNNLTDRTLKAIEALEFKDVLVSVILGIGHTKKEELRSYINNLSEKGFKVSIKENIKMMSEEIKNADFVITSNGVTVFEIATMRVPFISISQNEVEKKHSFVQKIEHIKYLGSANEVSSEDIASAVKELANSYELRKQINIGLTEFSSSEGVNKTLKLILNNYYEQKRNKNK